MEYDVSKIYTARAENSYQKNVSIKSNSYTHLFYFIFPLFTEVDSAIEQLLPNISKNVQLRKICRLNDLDFFHLFPYHLLKCFDNLGIKLSSGVLEKGFFKSRKRRSFCSSSVPTTTLTKIRNPPKKRVSQAYLAISSFSGMPRGRTKQRWQLPGLRR